MGGSYSSVRMKSSLKMCAQRLAMQRNKKSNSSAVSKKAIALLLQSSRSESARIRCESLLAELSLERAMEILQLQVELVSARASMIDIGGVDGNCPEDLEETLASILYCVNRVEIPELQIIAQQLGNKYGAKWVKSHMSNASGKVNPRILTSLALTPPPFDLVLITLQGIAADYSVDWNPDLSGLEAGLVDRSDPEALGSIAPISNANEPGGARRSVREMPEVATPAAAGPTPIANPAQQQSYAEYAIASPSNASSSSSSVASPGSSPYPGTLNIILYEGRDFPLSSGNGGDLYLRLTYPPSASLSASSSSSSSSSVTDLSLTSSSLGPESRTGGPRSSPSSSSIASQFPAAVRDGSGSVRLEACECSSSKSRQSVQDRVLGSVMLQIDFLRTHPSKQWYTLTRVGQPIGSVLLATQYMSLESGGGGGGGGGNGLGGARGSVDPDDERVLQAMSMMQARMPVNDTAPHEQSSSSSAAGSIQPDAPPGYDSSSHHHHEGRPSPDERKECTDDDGADVINGEGGSLSFPDVPSHSAGSGRRGSGTDDGASSGGSGKSGGGGGGGGQQAKSNSAGGGTLYAQRPKRVDEDAELEKRFNKLK